jgi:hypothetical protein
MEYDVFREELAIKHPAYGHALWVTSPGDIYSTVEVGDVGFIREGIFHRIFNVLLPDDHPSHENFGVPEYHKPLELKIKTHIYTNTLDANSFLSRGVRVVPDLDPIHATG